MKKQHKNGVAVLIVLSIIAKVIGVFYRIPLFAVLKAEGMGIYQLAFSLYALLVALISGGTTVAVSRFIATNRMDNKLKNSETTVDTALVLFGGIGLIFSVVLCIFSQYVSIFLGNSQAKYPLMAIAPSVFFSVVIAVLRGYYQSVEKSSIVGLSFVGEQVLKLSGIVFASLFSRKNMVFAVVGAMLGITGGESLTALFLIVAYLKKKRCTFGFDFAKIKGLLLCGVPVGFGSLIFPLGTIFEGIIAVNQLSIIMTRSEATALYGLLGGVVNPIISMPAVVSSSFCSWFFPKLCSTAKEYRRVKLGAYAKLPLVFSLVASFSVLIFAKEALSVLYSLTDYQLHICNRLLVIGSPIVFLSGALSLITIYLQSENKPYLPAINLLIATLIKLAVMSTAVQNFSVYGVQICAVIGYVIAFTLGCLQSMSEGFGFSMKTLVVITATGGVFLIIAGGLYSLIPSVMGCFIAFIVGGSASGVLFAKLTNVRLPQIKIRKTIK